MARPRTNMTTSKAAHPKPTPMAAATSPVPVDKNSDIDTILQFNHGQYSYQALPPWTGPPVQGKISYYLPLWASDSALRSSLWVDLEIVHNGGDALGAMCYFFREALVVSTGHLTAQRHLVVTCFDVNV